MLKKILSYIVIILNMLHAPWKQKKSQFMDKNLTELSPQSEQIRAFQFLPKEIFGIRKYQNPA